MDKSGVGLLQTIRMLGVCVVLTTVPWSAGLAAPRLPSGSKVNPTPSANQLESRRQAIVHTKRPRKACFTAKYPDTTWTEVPCIKPPNTPFLRASGIRPLTVVGNGTDFSARLRQGSFPRRMDYSTKSPE
jgi:hypothetical protein